MQAETTLEKLAAAQQNALGVPYPGWDELDDETKKQIIRAKTDAVEALPDRIVFSMPGYGDLHQDMTDFMATLLDEQKYADQRRSQEQGI